MKVNGHRNKRGSGGVDCRRIRVAVFAAGNCIIAPRPAQPLAHERVDHAPAQKTGSARGGMRTEHPNGRESRARAAGRKQSTPRPPEPQATTHIEQLNTQEMVAYKPADSCVAA